MGGFTITVPFYAGIGVITTKESISLLKWQKIQEPMLLRFYLLCLLVLTGLTANLFTLNDVLKNMNVIKSIIFKVKVR